MSHKSVSAPYRRFLCVRYAHLALDEAALSALTGARGEAEEAAAYEASTMGADVVEEGTAGAAIDGVGGGTIDGIAELSRARLGKRRGR